MTVFTQGAVTEIQTSAPNVYAFKLRGHLDDDTSEALANYVNDIFDEAKHEVHLLFDLSQLDGNDSSAILKPDVLRSRLRSISNIGKYAVIGAPDMAETMIEAMDKIVPVDAKTFDAGESDKAWTFVEAHPKAA